MELRAEDGTLLRKLTDPRRPGGSTVHGRLHARGRLVLTELARPAGGRWTGARPDLPASCAGNLELSERRMSRPGRFRARDAGSGTSRWTLARLSTSRSGASLTTREAPNCRRRGEWHRLDARATGSSFSTCPRAHGRASRYPRLRTTSRHEHGWYPGGHLLARSCRGLEVARARAGLDGAESHLRRSRARVVRGLLDRDGRQRRREGTLLLDARTGEALARIVEGRAGAGASQVNLLPSLRHRLTRGARSWALYSDRRGRTRTAPTESLRRALAEGGFRLRGVELEVVSP